MRRFDNAHWPAAEDERLVAHLNEKASEDRKHPRNIRSAQLGQDSGSLFDALLAPPQPAGEAPAGVPGGTAGERQEEELEAGAPDVAWEGGAGEPARARLHTGFAAAGAGDAISGSTPCASPALVGPRQVSRGDVMPLAWLDGAFAAAAAPMLSEAEGLAGAARMGRAGAEGDGEVGAEAAAAASQNRGLPPKGLHAERSAATAAAVSACYAALTVCCLALSTH